MTSKRRVKPFIAHFYIKIKERQKYSPNEKISQSKTPNDHLNLSVEMNLRTNKRFQKYLFRMYHYCLGTEIEALNSY
jgi:hypothetical protein